MSYYVLETLIKWSPLLLEGFALNILMSIIAMFIGTIAGIILGINQLSPNKLVATVAQKTTRFFRDAPWLVILFLIMYLVPFRVRLAGMEIHIPDWAKAIVGFSIPVAANISEVTRGAVQSIAKGQWLAANALGMSRFEAFWLVIFPQCISRMLPAWMNWYAILLMATALASLLGVNEVMTMVLRISSTESKSVLLVPLYVYAMTLFFAFCFPIALIAKRLERRTQSVQ